MLKNKDKPAIISSFKGKVPARGKWSNKIPIQYVQKAQKTSKILTFWINSD